jgi:hypothetical protein
MTWKTGSVLKVCIKTHFEDCQRIKSDDACVELELDGPAKSGKALSPGVQCTAYRAKGCSTSAGYFSVDEDGYKEFPFSPKSFKCPCVSSK